MESGGRERRRIISSGGEHGLRGRRVGGGGTGCGRVRGIRVRNPR